MAIFVVVDGLIGAGKSTILKELKKLGYQIEEQPVGEWEHLLKLFYADPKKYTLPLQIQIIKSYNDIIQRNNDYSKRIVLLESFAYASLGSFGQMLSDHLTAENQLYLQSLATPVQISAYFWLDTSPEVCLQRIKERSRDFESNIPIEYLNDLNSKYHDFMKTINVPVINVNNEDACKTHACNRIHAIISSNNINTDIAIEGVMGSGKTTLGTDLKNHIQFVQQIITPQLGTLIKERYKFNSDQHTYLLQQEFVQMYIGQMNKIKDGTDPVVWEGVLSLIHVFSTIAYSRDDISGPQLLELRKLYDANNLPNYRKFKLIVYLDNSVERLMLNIKKRARPGEESIPEEYVSLVKDTYENYLKFDNVLCVDNYNKTCMQVWDKVFKEYQRVYFKY